MSKVEYLGHRPVQVVPATGAATFTAYPGGVFEVDAKTAASLCEQSRKFKAVKANTKEGEKE
jgi:hypothetical protein